MSDTRQRPPIPPPFSCAVTQQRDTAVLRLIGELDLASAPVLRAEIAGLREAGIRSLVVDLSGLAFMDSAGLHCILDFDSEARQDGFSIALIKGPRTVHRVFEVTQTHAYLRFVDGEGRAVDV